MKETKHQISTITYGYEKLYSEKKDIHSPDHIKLKDGIHSKLNMKILKDSKKY